MEATQVRVKLSAVRPLPRLITANCGVCGKERPRNTLRPLPMNAAQACADCWAQWALHGNTG